VILGYAGHSHHEHDAGRLRPRLHRRPGPHRPARRARRPRRPPERIYVDHRLTGTNRARPGLREALAACRAGDTLVVTKLDRPACSVPDARAIADELTAGEVKLSIGGSVHDPTDPVGRLLFNALAMIAEFEADLARLRTREGMKAAKAKGRLRGKQPKLTPRQEAHLVELHQAGKHPSAELAELFNVARSTVYRALARARATT
jgi:DNA invertase Pin-like site-specific DNA recombinase